MVNKIDRPAAGPDWVVDRTFDLFVELGATDEQADLPVLYTRALEGRAGRTPEALADDLTPLFETILAAIPPPELPRMVRRSSWSLRFSTATMSARLRWAA